MPVRRKNTIDPLELTPGDAVVHNQHGVGRYVEMVQRSVAGSVREYLVIEYAASKRGQPGDRLYVPMDSLDQVTRYVGGENPTLDKMGGADWSKRKGRARKAVREIAGELIKLYAARQASRGHAFGPDTTWQRELEDAFSFVETPDQLAAIDEVKHDMEQVVPMDRLICGDVGYGKTEVALRAAFKAAGVNPVPPVTGNDATLAALQLIIAGDQYNTISKPSEIVAAAAARVAVGFLAGETPKSEMKLYDTPSQLFTPAVVTAKNLKAEIIDKKIATAKELCTGRYADGCKKLGISN
jgi:RNA polymerase-interacting CarD/CdnL/TRCF family regulator